MGTQALVAYQRDGVNLAGNEAPARLIMPGDRSSARSLYGLTRLDVRVTTTNTTAGNNAQNNTADQSNKTTGRRHLPRTASNLALFELLSGLAIFSGLALRRARLQA